MSLVLQVTQTQAYFLVHISNGHFELEITNDLALRTKNKKLLATCLHTINTLVH